MFEMFTTMFRSFFPVSYRSKTETKPVWEIPGDYTNAPTENIHDNVTQYEQDGAFPSNMIPRTVTFTERMVDKEQWPSFDAIRWVRRHSTILEVGSGKKTYAAERAHNPEDKSVTMIDERFISDDLEIVDKQGEKQDCFEKIHRYFRTMAAAENQAMQGSLVNIFTHFACSDKPFSPESILKEMAEDVNQPKHQPSMRR